MKTKTIYQVITSRGEENFRTLAEAKAVAQANNNAAVWRDNGTGEVELVKGTGRAI